MSSGVASRKYVVVVLAAVVVGLAAFVGACALVYTSNQSSNDDGGWYPVGEPAPLPPRWTPDGTKIVLDSWWGPYLVDVSADPPKLTEVVVGKQQERFYPHISPDGSRMVFSTQRYEGDEDNSEIGVSNLDGSEYRRLTRNRGDQYGARWSPDGTQIAFISCLSDREDIDKISCSLFVMAANGSGPRKLVDSVEATGGIAWSPDGRRIAFLGYEQAQLGEWPRDNYIYIVNRDGSNLVRLAEASSRPAWSPDGSTIAFMRRDHGNSLFVMNPDGSELQRIANLYSPFMPKWAWTLSQEFSWSPDGSEILLQDYPFIRVNADGTDYPGKESHYAAFAGPERWYTASASWSPNGSRIAIAVQNYDESDSDEGYAVLLTMTKDGSDKRVLVRAKRGVGFYAVPNEPWDEEVEWIWPRPDQ